MYTNRYFPCIVMMISNLPDLSLVKAWCGCIILKCEACKSICTYEFLCSIYHNYIFNLYNSHHDDALCLVLLSIDDPVNYTEVYGHCFLIVPWSNSSAACLCIFLTLALRLSNIIMSLSACMGYI